MRLTADSFSAGVSVGVLCTWVVNALDLGVLTPLQINGWRLFTGTPMLPLRLGHSFAQELTTFNRWWFVVFATVVLVISAAVLISRNGPFTVRSAIAPTVVFFVLFFVSYQLYWIPTSTSSFVAWMIRLTTSCLLSVVVGTGVLFFVYRSMLRFAEVERSETTRTNAY